MDCCRRYSLQCAHLHWVIQHHSKCWIAVGILPYSSRHSLQCVYLHWDIQLPQGSWGHSATLVVAGDIQLPTLVAAGDIQPP